MTDISILRQAFANYLGDTSDALEKAVLKWDEVTSGDAVSLDVLEEIFADLVKSLATSAANGMAFMQEHDE